MWEMAYFFHIVLSCSDSDKHCTIGGSAVCKNVSTLEHMNNHHTV